jgi:addiction module HigA family antidote
MICSFACQETEPLFADELSRHLPAMKTNRLPPIHPGEILREEFMKPFGLSQNGLARALRVPPRRFNEIVQEKRAITADTALRLARFFGTTAEMWTGLQADYDLRLARYKKQQQIEGMWSQLQCWNLPQAEPGVKEKRHNLNERAGSS